MLNECGPPLEWQILRMQIPSTYRLLFYDLFILSRLLELECHMKAFRSLGYNQTCNVLGLGGV